MYNPVYEGGTTHVGCWAHARRFLFDARVSDPERAHEALSRVRALYAVEREANEKELTGADLATYRREHAGAVLAAFGEWLAEQRPRVLPKSLIGEAVTYVTNQWSTLDVYLTDGRLTIDNAAAGQALRPLCVGRSNWLHLGGDGGLKPTAVLFSVTASVKRHGLDPWAYLRHLLTELPARPAGADLGRSSSSGPMVRLVRSRSTKRDDPTVADPENAGASSVAQTPAQLDHFVKRILLFRRS